MNNILSRVDDLIFFRGRDSRLSSASSLELAEPPDALTLQDDVCLTRNRRFCKQAMAGYALGALATSGSHPRCGLRPFLPQRYDAGHDRPHVDVQRPGGGL